jgi:uncharacterized protein YcsI (UPF0317 family)
MISPESHRTAFSHATAREVREACRAGRLTGPTAGLARGFAQANLVILPCAYADDFAAFCRANPKPCPLIEMSPPGCFEAVRSAPGSDLRTDLPRYRVLKSSVCVDRPTDVRAYWPDDAETTDASKRRETLVAFLLGCSFTFEAALLRENIPVRHIEEGRNVPMFRTNIACRGVGPFAGPLVVSMRPMTPSQAERAAAITRPFANAHGEPVHVGNPGAIGITDINCPDYGDAVTIRDNEIPVFWACGVTPMEVILNAQLPLAITHEPGHMFVTDLTVSI